MIISALKAHDKQRDAARKKRIDEIKKIEKDQKLADSAIDLSNDSTTKLPVFQKADDHSWFMPKKLNNDDLCLPPPSSSFEEEDLKPKEFPVYIDIPNSTTYQTNKKLVITEFTGGFKVRKDRSYTEIYGRIMIQAAFERVCHGKSQDEITFIMWSYIQMMSRTSTYSSN